MAEVFLSIGSNIEPGRNIRACLAELERLFGKLRRSSVYETAPLDGSEQPRFLNLVVSFETSLRPRQLLSVLQCLEGKSGRVRGERLGPRTLDLDILLFGTEVLSEQGLTIPHPGLLERDFMLAPLAEIASHLLHPLTKEPLASSLSRVAHRCILKKVTLD